MNDLHDASRRRLVAAALGVFLLALATRLVYILALRQTPWFDHLLVDAQWHDEWARAWAAGEDYLGGRSFFRAPLYPAWLSLLYRVFGHDLLAVRVVEGVIGSTAAVALFGVGRRLGGFRVGVMAGVLTALYGPLVYFTGELLIPNLLVTLLAWAAYFLTDPSQRRNVVVGAVLLGLAIITRPNAITVLAATIPFVLWSARTAGRRGWTEVLLLTSVALVPAAVVTGINAAVEGRFVFVASQGGVNFYAGNHPGATGRSVQIPELDNLINWRQFLDGSSTIAETDLGRPLASDEISGWWLRRGFTFWREHPGDALALTARKAYYLVNGFEVPNNRDPYFETPAPLRPLLWTTGFLSFPWGLVFPLALAGMVIGFRDVDLRPRVTLFAGWALLFGLSILPFFVSGRFRMGMVVAILPLAALALARGRALVRPLPLGLLLAGLVVSNTGFLDARLRNPADERTKLGAVLLQAGDVDGGIAQLERAVGEAPGRVAPALLLADAYYEQHRLAEAHRMYERVVALQPGSARARFGLGVIYLEQERYDDAVNTLETATRIDPDDASSWVNLGVAYEGRGMDDEAVAAMTRGVQVAPHAELGYLLLARLHLKRDEATRAVEVLESGVRSMRGSFMLHLQLALAYDQLGRPDLGLEEVEAALTLAPRDERALKIQAYLSQRSSRTRDDRDRGQGGDRR